MLTAALEWTGTAERIVLASAMVVALGVLWRYLVRPVWRLYRWLRHEVHDEIERRKKVDDLIHRELTHNGGKSIKDVTTGSAAMLAALGSDVNELRESQETTFQLLDAVVERKGTEHDEIWAALAALGVDRRNPNRPTRRSE